MGEATPTRARMELRRRASTRLVSLYGRRAGRPPDTATTPGRTTKRPGVVACFDQRTSQGPTGEGGRSGPGESAVREPVRDPAWEGAIPPDLHRQRGLGTGLWHPGKISRKISGRLGDTVDAAAERAHFDRPRPRSRRRFRSPVRPADRPPCARGEGVLRDRPAHMPVAEMLAQQPGRDHPLGRSLLGLRARALPPSTPTLFEAERPGLRHVLRLPGDGPGRSAARWPAPASRSSAVRRCS